MPNLSDSSSENENVDKDIVQLFASDSEVETNIQNENADRPNTRSVASTSTTGKGKGISSNKRGKAPAKKVNNKRKNEEKTTKNKKQQDFNPSKLFSLLNEFLKRTEHVDNNDNPCTSVTTGENPEGVIECFPDSDFDHVQNNETDIFSIDNDPEVVFDDDNSEISMPKIYLRMKQNFQSRFRKI